MAQELQYTSDKNKGIERARGSDHRLNVSSRQDSRSYYNSRDESQTFSLTWDDPSSEAGDYIAYWKNTDTTGKVLVIGTVELNCFSNAGHFVICRVSGTAASGTTATPFCNNQSSPKTAQATAMESAGTAITGLSCVGKFDTVLVSSDGHEEINLKDRVRIGQDQAIAIQFQSGTTSRTTGTIHGYYE